MKEEVEGGDTTYVGLEWKVKQLVTAAINLQTMKPALTKHFAEETLNAVSLEDLKAALAALQSIEERDLEEDEDELSAAGKIHILKQVVAYLEHAPYAELPYSCGEVVKEVMTNFYSIRAATTNLLNYRKLQAIHEEINDENVAEHCYENLFNYHIEPLAKNSHEFRTILKYLAETNMTPKTSLQVKEVFALKEKAAYAEHVHGAGFEATYNDKKRMLLWHGVPRHQVFHALTAEIPRTAQGSFLFSSQFAYAVCQEQETYNSNYREPAAQENACLLLAEVAVGEPEGLGLRPSFPLSAFRNDPCRLARNWPMERLSDKVLRNDHATHNETNSASHEVTKLQDGVVVPQGPVRCLPLGMIQAAPGHAPVYTAPTHKQFRLRFLVVVDYLASDLSSSSSSSSLMSSSLLPSPPSSFSSLPSSLSLPSMPSFPSMPSMPLMPSMPSMPSLPAMPSSSTSFLPPPLPLSSPSSSSFMLAPSAGSSTFSFTHAPPARPATITSSSSSAYHYMPPAPAPHTLSSVPMPLMRSAFTPTTTLTPLRPYAYGPPMMVAHSLTPPPTTTPMSPSSAGHSMSSDFTLRPLEPDWQFYKPEDGTWESFEETGNWSIESSYQAYLRSGGALPHPSIVGGNGVVYNIDYANMVQYRQDDPDRIRKIRRC